MLTPQELDSIIRNLPEEAIIPISKPKKWKRVPVGQIEVYIGDNIYVVALVDKLSKSVDELTAAQVNTENTVIKYLQSEGFISKEYAYIGMQRFALNEPT